MTTRTKILQLIDRIETEYLFCWQILGNLKEKSQLSRDDLEEFQPKLASALFDLDHMYRQIISEENRLIRNKLSLSNRWFRQRMKTLKEYRESLKKVMDIGRSIGDAFAWMFYMREREYLEKHFEHEPITHTPPGIGGTGELEIIKNIKFINGQMAIYHGITTFLRIGDFSLFDLRTLRLSALAELKTERTGTDEITMRLHILGPNHSQNIFLTNRSGPENIEPLSESVRQKLQRQLKEMSDALTIQEPTIKGSSYYAGYVQELANLAKISRLSLRTHRKIGDGLMLICYRNRSNNKQRLSTRIMNRSRSNTGNMAEGIENLALEIMNKDVKENSLIIDTINTDLFLGIMPIFWWNVPLEFLRALYFKEILVFTLYNPLHLAQKLKKSGFDVAPTANYTSYEVSKTIDGNVLEVGGFDYFTMLVRRHLMKEEVVIEILTSILEKVESGEFQLNTRVDLRLFLQFLS